MGCNQIWNTIVALETDKYDYEQRQLDQDYEFNELAERQKLQLRNKAIKKGLDPESFTQKHPPTIHMFSKYERRTDTRTYGDRKKLYEGGAEVIRSEMLEAAWKKKRRRRKRRSKQISLFDSLTAILRESNHYRCNFESFHTGHCFYTKLVIA